MRIKDPKTGNWLDFPDSQIKKLDPDPEFSRYYDGLRDDYEHFKPTDKDILKEEIYRPPMLRVEDLLNTPLDLKKSKSKSKSK